MRKALILITVFFIFLSCGKKTGFTSEEIDFTTADGTVLKGTLYLPLNLNEKRPGVILAHMNLNNRKSWEYFAGKLAENDYISLAFDFRDGEGAQRIIDCSKMKDDVQAAVNTLANFSRVERDKIAAVGASIGGAAVIFAAVETSAIKAVATISTPPYWKEIEPFAVVGRISPRPLLVIAGVYDGHLDLKAAKELYLHAREPRQWKEIPTNRFGTDIFATAYAAELETTLLDFLNHYLKNQTDNK